MPYKQIFFIRKDIKLSNYELLSYMAFAGSTFLLRGVEAFKQPVLGKGVKFFDLYGGDPPVAKSFKNPVLNKIASKERKNGELVGYYKRKDDSDPSSEIVECPNPYEDYNISFTINKTIYDSWREGSWGRLLFSTNDFPQLEEYLKKSGIAYNIISSNTDNIIISTAPVEEKYQDYFKENYELYK